jgi:hypothetical protein
VSNSWQLKLTVHACNIYGRAMIATTKRRPFTALIISHLSLSHAHAQRPRVSTRPQLPRRGVCLAVAATTGGVTPVTFIDAETGRER